ncbi:ABC transporter permease subunit [Palaeococcus ferrophilus]|uniref:ABC transporter permease subunit n=1 Tax=Palaeococcus ferrophilus TaxID=83868 RepID=UPI001FE03022|nr:ABC transporter permease subunit [Palaeococcus ferrophilus]
MVNRLTVAGAIIALYLIGALVTPHLVDERDIENWDSKEYWLDNPKLAPPEWVSFFNKGLPRGEKLKTKDGRTFEYDFHYSRAPKDMVIFINNSDSKRVSITIETPSGKRYTLYKGYPMKKILISRQVVRLMEIAKDKGLNTTETDILFGDSLLPVFFVKEGDKVAPEKGRYRITVNASGEVGVKVLGRTYGLMGTDVMGRNIWSGFLWGLRETVWMVLLTGTIAVFLGSLFGLVSSMTGKLGWLGDSLAKFSALLPVVPLMIALVPVMGEVSVGGRLEMSTFWFSTAIALALMGKVSRNVKAIVDVELSKDYVKSARAVGGSTWWILKHHISRVVLPYSIYQLSLLIPKIVALISLLGFFSAAPGFNWGTMLAMVINENQLYSGAWWLVLPIGFALAFFAFAFVLINREMEKRFMEVFY